MRQVQIENRGRLTIVYLSILVAAMIITSCDDRNPSSSPTTDFEAPPVPTGVTTTTGDTEVWIFWEPIYLDRNYDDLAGFRVYRSDDNLNFTHIATVDPDVTDYNDNNLVNGETYYYAITSFDTHGNESDLSYDSAYDTPRPEGFGYIIYTFTDVNYEALSGFDLSTGIRLPWDHTECDFYLEYDPDPNVRAFFIWLGDNGAFLQDMGYTDSFDDITYAPTDGWSNFQYTEVILGHTYVLMTSNDHYAKVRVTGQVIDPTDGIEFSWGYQIDPGNRELKIEPSRRALIDITDAESAH
jgi:hypothetical protein